jgi:hypothetical protein
MCPRAQLDAGDTDEGAFHSGEVIDDNLDG